jgi:uncharacterized membrane protein YwaF
MLHKSSCDKRPYAPTLPMHLCPATSYITATMVLMHCSGNMKRTHDA